MHVICSGLAFAFTRWLERSATAAAYSIAGFIIAGVHGGCSTTRRAAVTADDLFMANFIKIKAGLLRLLRFPR
ncbi:MAG TPA: hypothetical protein GXX19_00725 [Syntrophomonadaceae bacterium]|nr:hypothetical protein [Syntrophomonadaceae bacterium]